ncbi:hypothetical protein ILYODFUR_029502 [Ilyodon furcidens]|uniref:Secreted protein n=1 Tax=Ilyodon furcidens TaxID=33524 RepID=A0ABV0UKB2_9TELE
MSLLKSTHSSLFSFLVMSLSSFSGFSSSKDYFPYSKTSTASSLPLVQRVSSEHRLFCMFSFILISSQLSANCMVFFLPNLHQYICCNGFHSQESREQSCISQVSSYLLLQVSHKASVHCFFFVLLDFRRHLACIVFLYLHS